MATTQAGNKPPEELTPPFVRPEPEILRRVWNRLNRRNEHFMMAIVGEEGSGKSLTAIKIGKNLDGSFDADNVIFDLDEFLVILRDEKYNQGDVYVLDEAGVSLGKRTWHDDAQIKVNKALQLIRSHNIGLIFTLPRLDELDSQTQGRLQAFYEIIDKQDGKYVSGKWKYIDPNRSGDGTVYKKYPRLKREGPTHRVTSLAFSPPEGDIVDEYLKAKKAHQKRVYDDALDALRDDAEEESRSDADIAEEILDESAEEYVSEHAQNKTRFVDHELIKSDFDISIRQSKRVKKLIEREIDL